MGESIWFVGMKYRGNHQFSSKDVIKLELEDDNVYDRNAVKVLVLKGDKYVHVAHCDRESARLVRKHDDLDNLIFTLDEYYPQSVKFRMNLAKDTPSKPVEPTKVVETAKVTEVDQVIEKLETLNIKPPIKTSKDLLTSIAKGVRQIRAISIDDLRVGTVLRVKGIKEYTYRNVRKIMLLSNGRYYYSNAFLEDALPSMPQHSFDLHIIAQEGPDKRHNQVKIEY